MNSKLEKAITLVEGSDQKTGECKPLGTGFLITKSLALTALHVVVDRKEKKPLFKYFWMTSGSYRTKIKPLKYDLEQDWVLVQCLTNADTYGIDPLELCITPAEDSPWKTFGWPQNLQHIDGITLKGKITNPLAKLNNTDAIQLYCEQAVGNHVDLRGLSGSPILYKRKAFGISRFQLSGGTGENLTVKAGTIYASPIECIYDKKQLPEIPSLKFVDVDTYLKYQSWIDELKQKPGKSLSFSRGFIATSFIKAIYQECIYSSGIVCVIGAMGTGKSSIAGYVAEEYLRNNKDGTVIILPLSPLFYKNDTSEIIEVRVRKFIEALKLASERKHHKTLFVIEDLHESISSISIWSDNSSFILKNCSLLITTRPENYQDQLSRLETLMNSPKCTLRYTNPDTTARAIIERELSNLEVSNIKDVNLVDAVRDELSKLYFSGRNLVYLNAIIKGWKKDWKKSITKDSDKLPNMNHAYQAVFEELKRVSHNAGHEDPVHMSSLLLLWMLGGIEISVEENFLNTQFNLQTQRDFWDSLITQNEIRYSDETDELRSLRHPAWGTLTIIAVDVDPLSIFWRCRETIVNGFRTSIEYRFTSIGSSVPDDIVNKLNDNIKPSICLLAALMLEDINDADSLNRYCSGKSIHDEFVEAVTLVEMVLKELDPDDLKSSERLISSSDSIRRCAGDDPLQLQQLIEEGYHQLLLAIEKRKNYFNEQQERDPKRGFYLYNYGYYLYLMGRLNDAKVAFLESVNAELIESITGNNERRKFAVMSSVMVSRVYLALNDIESSLSANHDAEILLGNLNNFGEKRSLFYRFRANIDHVFFEIALATSEYEMARQRLEQYTQEALDGGSYSNSINSVHQARISLAEGDGDTAKKLALSQINSLQYKPNSETLIVLNRVLGDIYLFLGETNQALHYYQQVLPPLDLNPRYLSPELLLIESRVQKIQEGRPIGEILDKF